MEKLSDCGVSCYIGHQCFNVVAYADDITLLCPWVSALETMLSICTSFTTDNDILYTVAKLVCLRCSRHSCYLICLVITICDKVLPWTNSVMQLGHKLTSHRSDAVNIRYKLGTFLGQTQVWFTARRCKVLIISIIYCSSFYGCEL